MHPIPSPSTPSTSAPLLQAQDLACERGGAVLFRGLNFALHSGQLIWLRGRNGQGKTTLMRALAGLVEPTEGQVLLNGHALRKAGAPARAGLLLLGHANALKDDLSLAEALRFSASLRGSAPAAAAIAQALDVVGLMGMAARAVRGLSQGQRRRAALARLVLVQAQTACRVWLLDEPFDALDDDGIARLVQLLLAHVQAGGAVVFTSHQAVPALEAAAAQNLRHIDLHGYAAKGLAA